MKIQNTDSSFCHLQFKKDKTEKKNVTTDRQTTDGETLDTTDEEGERKKLRIFKVKAKKLPRQKLL